jgi:hypothetical protein
MADWCERGNNLSYRASGGGQLTSFLPSSYPSAVLTRSVAAAAATILSLYLTVQCFSLWTLYTEPFSFCLCLFPLHIHGPITGSFESKYTMVIIHQELTMSVTDVKSATISYDSNILSLILRGCPQGVFFKNMYPGTKLKKKFVFLCWVL